MGGASAVLLNWRETTIDIELDASPSQFIPPVPGWQDRSPFIIREWLVDFHHYDFYAQALSKIERAHAKDKDEVREMARRPNAPRSAPPCCGAQPFCR